MWSFRVCILLSEVHVLTNKGIEIEEIDIVFSWSLNIFITKLPSYLTFLLHLSPSLLNSPFLPVYLSQHSIYYLFKKNKRL